MCVDIVLTFYRLGERLDIVQENPWPRAEGCPHKLSDPPSQWATTIGAQPRQHHPNVWPQGVSHSQHNVKLYFSLVIWSHVFFFPNEALKNVYFMIAIENYIHEFICTCTWIRVLVTVSSMLSCTIHLYILTLLAFPFFFIVLLSMIL